jgi:hypothetical protein
MSAEKVNFDVTTGEDDFFEAIAKLASEASEAIRTGDRDSAKRKLKLCHLATKAFAKVYIIEDASEGEADLAEAVNEPDKVVIKSSVIEDEFASDESTLEDGDEVSDALEVVASTAVFAGSLNTKDMLEIVEPNAPTQELENTDAVSVPRVVVDELSQGVSLPETSPELEINPRDSKVPGLTFNKLLAELPVGTWLSSREIFILATNKGLNIMKSSVQKCLTPSNIRGINANLAKVGFVLDVDATKFINKYRILCIDVPGSEFSINSVPSDEMVEGINAPGSNDLNLDPTVDTSDEIPAITATKPSPWAPKSVKVEESYPLMECEELCREIARVFVENNTEYMSKFILPFEIWETVAGKVKISKDNFMELSRADEFETLLGLSLGCKVSSSTENFRRSLYFAPNLTNQQEATVSVDASTSFEAPLLFTDNERQIIDILKYVHDEPVSISKIARSYKAKIGSSFVQTTQTIERILEGLKFKGLVVVDEDNQWCQVREEVGDVL